MTRLLHSLAITAIALSAMIPGKAMADWHPDRPAASRPAVTLRDASPQSIYLRNHGITPPGTRIHNARTGLAPTPSVSTRAAAPLKKSPQAPRGNLYGVVNRFDGMEFTGQAYVGQLNLSTGWMQPLYSNYIFSPYANFDYTLQTNALRKGEIICPSVRTTQSNNVIWDFIDLESGDYLYTLDFGSDMMANAYSMTYDPDKDLIYMVSLDSSTDGHLVIADPKNDYQLTYVGNLRQKGKFIAALAYNMADHQLYAFNNFNSAFIVNTSNATLIEAGYIELPTGEMLFTEGTTGQVVYSPADEMFVAIRREMDTQQSNILYIHPETFEVFEGAAISAPKAPYINALFCTDDFAMPDAPELAEAPAISFDKASLNGSITFKAPTYTYAGVALGSSKVTMHLVIDGEEYFCADMSPGESRTVQCTLSEGIHDLQLYGYLGNDRSPVRQVSFHTGHDNPLPPSELSVSGATLSWTAPGETGAHGGFVETSALTYNVYLNGKIQNSSPIAATSYTLELPADYDIYDLSVTASANGKNSEAATLTTLFGKPMTLPFHQLPTPDQQRYYTTANINSDERVWTYIDGDIPSELGVAPDIYGWCFATGYMGGADDWLFLPAIDIPDPDRLYTFSFSMMGIYGSPTVESFEIWLGSAPTPEAMKSGTCLIDRPEYTVSGIIETMSFNFGVKKAAQYVIGIRYKGSPDIGSQGFLINELDIRPVDGKTSAIPSDPTDVTLEPAPNGRNALTLKFTMPSTDLADKPLPATSQISVEVSAGADSVVITGTPGSSVSREVELSAGGRTYVSLTPFNDMGRGYTRSYSVYVGIDRPKAPKSFSCVPSADNLTLHLKWEAPSEVGENDGYVDIAGLTYNIYARANSGNSNRVASTSDTSYDYSPFTVQNPPLAVYSVGVAASNEGGESYDTQYTIEHLGIPYELPMTEEWGVQSFDYSPYTAMTTDEYTGSAWQNVSSMSGVGNVDPQFKQGGLVAYAESGVGVAKAIFPKATTKGIAKANFILRYWDYPYAPKEIKVIGRRHGQPNEEVLRTIIPPHNVNASWIDDTLPLPEGYTDCDWVEFRVEGVFPGETGNEYLVLDSFRILADADLDLKVTSLSGPQQICVGETASYHVIVANSGRQAIGGELQMSLSGSDGKVYATATANMPRLSQADVFEYDVDFDINGIFRDISDLTMTARVDCNDDDLSNNVRSLPLKVMAGTLPIINDLTVRNNDGVPTLTWSEPPTEYGDFETFEAMLPFEITDNMEQWLNYDLDGLTPISLTNNATGQKLAWEDSDKPQGWTVVNVKTIGFMNEPRIAPRSGLNVLMARAGDYPDQDNPIQTSKWLVSPEIKGGTELSFWMSTLAADCMEYIEIWYSETDTTLDPSSATSTRNGSFRRARTFSKDGADTWELISCQLPASAKYFAIRYCSYDGAAVVIDDLSFTPAKMRNREISHYVIYRSVNDSEYFNISDEVKGTSYADNSWNGSNVAYCVATVASTSYGTAEGPRSNPAMLAGSGMVSLSSGSLIKCVPEGVALSGLKDAAYSVASADGAVVADGIADSDLTLIALRPGVYVVKAGHLSATVLVK